MHEFLVALSDRLLLWGFGLLVIGAVCQFFWFVSRILLHLSHSHKDEKEKKGGV